MASGRYPSGQTTTPAAGWGCDFSTNGCREPRTLPGSFVLRATPWLVALVAGSGIGYALYLKQRDPARYAMLGRTVLQESHER
ncbi:hypothetical protein [Nocardia sp. CA-135398]|uniref:hypothetical protein n=1 Tax=Nocardia sp. CA-135398 TaxID=3239977 RepID=UPI003D951D51